MSKQLEIALSVIQRCGELHVLRLAAEALPNSAWDPGEQQEIRRALECRIRDVAMAAPVARSLVRGVVDHGDAYLHRGRRNRYRNLTAYIRDMRWIWGQLLFEFGTTDELWQRQYLYLLGRVLIEDPGFVETGAAGEQVWSAVCALNQSYTAALNLCDSGDEYDLGNP